jgi:hypothetical protein
MSGNIISGEEERRGHGFKLTMPFLSPWFKVFGCIWRSLVGCVSALGTKQTETGVRANRWLRMCFSMLLRVDEGSSLR